MITATTIKTTGATFKSRPFNFANWQIVSASSVAVVYFSQTRCDRWLLLDFWNATSYKNRTTKPTEGLIFSSWCYISSVTVGAFHNFSAFLFTTPGTHFRISTAA